MSRSVEAQNEPKRRDGAVLHVTSFYERAGDTARLKVPHVALAIASANGEKVAPEALALARGARTKKREEKGRRPSPTYLRLKAVTVAAVERPGRLSVSSMSSGNSDW